MLTYALVLALSLAAAGPEPEPAATATPIAQREPLREIGHVRAVSSFCQAFIAHFNGYYSPATTVSAGVYWRGISSQMVDSLKNHR